MRMSHVMDFINLMVVRGKAFLPENYTEIVSDKLFKKSSPKEDLRVGTFMFLLSFVTHWLTSGIRYNLLVFNYNNCEVKEI